jgi:hypothetical protein
LFDINRDLHIKYALGAIQNLANDLSVKMSTGITIVEEVDTLIVQVAGVIAGETEDIAALSLDAVELKFQVDRATVVFDPHQVNDWLTISPG